MEYDSNISVIQFSSLRLSMRHLNQDQKKDIRHQEEHLRWGHKEAEEKKYSRAGFVPSVYFNVKEVDYEQ